MPGSFSSRRTIGQTGQTGRTGRTEFILALVLALPLASRAQSYAPNGGEYSISGALRGDQVRPQAALGPSGGYIVWQDNITAPYGLGISARATDSNFQGRGAAFRVNKTGLGDAENAQVSLLNNGGAMFVWQAGRQSFQHIYARAMSAGSTWVSGDVLVSSSTTTFQKQPAVATLSNGNVIIVWSSLGDLGRDNMLDVFGRIVDPTGAPTGGQFLVNEFATFNQRTPAVTALAGGGFVVAWVSEQQRNMAGAGTNSPSNTGNGIVASRPTVDVFARIFHADGTPANDEFLVNTTPADGSAICAEPKLTATPDGGFIAVWAQKTLQDRAGGWDIYSRAFSSAGTGGTASRLNTYTFGDQYSPQIRSIGGDTLAIWTSLGQDGSWEGVYGRFLQADGSASGDEFRLNTTTVGSQKEPALAADATGRFLAVWTSFSPASHSFDVFGQSYASANYTPLASTNSFSGPPAETFNDVPPASGSGSSANPGQFAIVNPGLAFPVAYSLPPLADPFASAPGAYSGLFYDTNGVAVSSSGFFSARVAPNHSFSAKVYLGGKSYSLSGIFDAAGSSGTLAVKGNGALSARLQLVRLDSSGATQIRGSISGAAWSAQVMADRVVFNATANPASAYAGTYTIVIPPSVSAANAGALVTSGVLAAQPEGRGPSGTGFGTVKVDSGGNVQWSGVLPDGTKVSQSTTVSEQGIWPLYASLYGGSGSLVSWAQFSANGVSGELIWSKPSSGNSKFYPQGFTNTLEIAGARYTGSAKAAPGLALQPGTHSLIFSQGGLSGAVTNTATLDANYKLISPSDQKLSLSFTLSSGLFKGNALNPQTGKLFPFQGILLENGKYGAGFFLGSALSGQVFLTAPQ
ncbi:MAG: hypothetical protein C5B50_21735 [Verrucomicrobia bacterium]|nr:MAG: hypothetical protein C5B50_21735 [Verrucomicrobiota bacterium]